MWNNLKLPQVKVFRYDVKITGAVNNVWWIFTKNTIQPKFQVEDDTKNFCKIICKYEKHIEKLNEKRHFLYFIMDIYMNKLYIYSYEELCFLKYFI